LKIYHMAALLSGRRGGVSADGSGFTGWSLRRRLPADATIFGGKMEEADTRPLLGAGDRNQGCQIFHGATYQSGNSIPNDRKIHRIAKNIPKWLYVCKISRMTIKCTNIFHSKALQNLLKLE
jgi:hypothetical protein